MPNVTYGGTTYPCAKALKGPDYIHLLDSDGCMIVAFDGVKDFSGFTIDTDWTAPTPEGECYLAVIGDDGVIRKGGHRCCDINVIGSWNTGVTKTTILPSSGLYEFKVSMPEVSSVTALVNWNEKTASSSLFHWEDRDLRELVLGYFYIDIHGTVYLRQLNDDGSMSEKAKSFYYRKLADA